MQPGRVDELAHSPDNVAHMTIKASSLFSIIAIWATMIPAVILEPDGWWSLFFAAFATLVVGVNAWRRLGWSRLLSIVGIWLGTAAAISESSGAAWTSIFAFLATFAVVLSIMRREAVGIGVGIAFAWLVTGAVVVANDGAGAWIAIFAYLTTFALANNRGFHAKGFAAMLWWGLAGAVMIAAGGWYWLSIFAFILSALSVGITQIRIPRGIEWDLWDRDERGELVR